MAYNAKLSFILSLQSTDAPLWPSDISQSIREKFGWVSLYKGDPELNPAILRAYMTRPPSNSLHSAEDPAHYWCVVATRQSMGWQNIAWTKEMLQVLDPEESLVTDPKKLGEMLDHNGPTRNDTPKHVQTDQNGYALALGCAVPERCRDRNRRHLADHGQLSSAILKQLEHIPEEHIEHVHSKAFEQEFLECLRELGYKG